MSSLEYGTAIEAGVILGDKFHYSQFVHLPNGITKVSGQGGWTADGAVDGVDWKAQIDQAFDNVENVLKAAGLSGWGDVYLMRSFMTDFDAHFEYVVDTIGKRIPHRPTWTAVAVPRLGYPTMVIEIEVEAYRK